MDKKMHTGVLYLCPTPIGNLEDMTYRAVRVLQESDFIAAEDTRHTGLLLKHFNIETDLLSYHEHNKEESGAAILSLLEEGKQVALVSDAGMPAISDPGSALVRMAIDNGISVIPLPGANAALTALIASGLDTREFTFIGFLPKKKKNRDMLLRRVATYGGTLIFYEAPHRVEETVAILLEELGNRPVVIGRELTKKFETFTRTTLHELRHNIEMVVLKGEFVLVVGGADTLEGALHKEQETPDPLEQVKRLIQSGWNKKDAVREVAKSLGLSRRALYNEVESALHGEEADNV